MYGAGTNPKIDEMLTIRPRPWARMCGRTALVILTTPKTLLLADIPNLWAATPDRLHAVMRAAVRGWHPGLIELVDRIDLATLFPLSVRRLGAGQAMGAECSH